MTQETSKIVTFIIHHCLFRKDDEFVVSLLWQIGNIFHVSRMFSPSAIKVLTTQTLASSFTFCNPLFASHISFNKGTLVAQEENHKIR